MKIVLYKTDYFTVHLQIVQDDLLLANDVWLEADDGIENVVCAAVVVDVLFVASDGVLDDAFELVDEKENDGIVLVLWGFVTVVKPDL